MLSSDEKKGIYGKVEDLQHPELQVQGELLVNHAI